MYKVTVKVDGKDTEDNETYHLNHLPLFIDKSNNMFKELIEQTKQDYLSVPPYKVIELPVMYIIGDSVKIYVYENDSVELEFE